MSAVVPRESFRYTRAFLQYRHIAITARLRASANIVRGRVYVCVILEIITCAGCAISVESALGYARLRARLVDELSELFRVRLKTEIL